MADNRMDHSAMERIAKLEVEQTTHANQLTDHEKRIRFVEKAITMAAGAYMLGNFVLRLMSH